MDLRKIETLFSENYDISNIIINATKYVENKLSENNNNLLSKKVTNGFHEFNKLRIEYTRIDLLLNEIGSSTPSFKVQFDLYEPNETFPMYYYQVKYNYLGEFLEEDFGEFFPNVME